MFEFIVITSQINKKKRSKSKYDQAFSSAPPILVEQNTGYDEATTWF